MAILQLLTLLIIANGAPVLAQWLFRDHGAQPIDGGRRLRDGRPLLGASKTWRGLAAALLVTPVAAPAIGVAILTALLIAAMAMLGDLLSSFIKRRLNLPPSSQALGLDQIPESVLPALAAAPFLPLSIGEALLTVLLFFFLELGLSRLLYRLGIRKQPY